MKVTLVYPPNRAIPSGPYGGLPLLAGCLGAAGHEVDIVDANLEVFERMATRATLEQCKGVFDATWELLRNKPDLSPDEARRLQGLATLAVVPIEELYQAEEAAKVLHDRELFLNPEKCNWAYDILANLIRVVYSINPVFQPLDENYRDDLFGYLEHGFDNPISQINEELILDLVLAGEPDLVAVTIPFNEQTTEALAFLKQLKARAPGLRTIVGGSIITAFHGILCADERFWQYADFAMPGEADESFPAFVTALEAGTPLEEVANLYWRDETGQVRPPSRTQMADMNKIPRPDFSAVPIERYFLPTPVVNYQTSRGCYYGKCTFCSDDIKANFRYRKAELVLDDVEHIRTQTGVRHIMFWDPLTPPRLMREIAKWNAARPEEERFYWAAETKFEPLFTNRDFTDLLYAGGARFLQFGFESGSQRVLDLMVKGNDLSRVHLMLDAMQGSGIEVSVQWFIGFPGATEAEDVASYRYLDEHRDGVLLSSYMGRFSISPTDDIFRSGGDMYDIDLFQQQGGMWDFRYRDGREHYDREELDAAMLSRGDAESVTRMHFYIYLTENPEQVREISNFEKGGMLPESWQDLVGQRPLLPTSNKIRTWDFDIFTSPEEQGISEQHPGRLPEASCHALLVTQTQVVYHLSDDEKRLVELADGTRTCEELLAELGGDTEHLRERLYGFVRRGILVVPHPARSRSTVAAV